MYEPASEDDAARRPAILLCYGWGGIKSDLAAYARAFARAGFVAMVFDYRGWGESDGRIIATPEAPPLLESAERDLRVRVLREIVDPIDQTTDVNNCLATLATEPSVDPSRLGIWGTSYGGGHALYTAGNQSRIRAVFAQIAGFDLPRAYRDLAQQRIADKARGLLAPVVPQDGLDASPNLKGTPDLARMVMHRVLAAAGNIRVPTLIVDAEHEELFNRYDNGYAAYSMIRDNATCEYRTLPSTHYAFYDRYFEETVTMALDWFRTHLMAESMEYVG